MSYTTTEEFALMGVTAESLNLDEAAYSLLISKIIAQAQSIIDTYCNRTFTEIQCTEKCDGDGTKELFTRNKPITELLSIYLDDVDVTDNAYVYNTYIYYPEAFTRGIQNVQITYKYGSAEVPAQITEVSFILCKKLLHRFKASLTSQGMKSESLDDYSYSIDDSSVLTDDLKQILNNSVMGGIL